MEPRKFAGRYINVIISHVDLLLDGIWLPDKLKFSFYPIWSATCFIWVHIRVFVTPRNVQNTPCVLWNSVYATFRCNWKLRIFSSELTFVWIMRLWILRRFLFLRPWSSVAMKHATFWTALVCGWRTAIIGERSLGYLMTSYSLQS
jgi:hypothetical protein